MSIAVNANRRPSPFGGGEGGQFLSEPPALAGGRVEACGVEWLDPPANAGGSDNHSSSFLYPSVHIGAQVFQTRVAH